MRNFVFVQSRNKMGQEESEPVQGKVAENRFNKYLNIPDIESIVKEGEEFPKKLICPNERLSKAHEIMKSYHQSLSKQIDLNQKDIASQMEKQLDYYGSLRDRLANRRIKLEKNIESVMNVLLMMSTRRLMLLFWL